MRLHRVSMTFDLDSKVTQEARGVVLQVLAAMAAESPQAVEHSSVQIVESTQKAAARGCLSSNLPGSSGIFKSQPRAPRGAELLRQVLWSIEAGALRRFSPLHAAHIALKKIREGAWTRPNRMPPNWSPGTSARAVGETCRAA